MSLKTLHVFSALLILLLLSMLTACSSEDGKGGDASKQAETAKQSGSATGVQTNQTSKSHLDNTTYTSDAYEYRILTDGTVEIKKYTGSSEFIEIPSQLDGSLQEALFLQVLIS